MNKYKFSIRLMAILIITLTLNGCTENIRARNFGGTATETLPSGQKLVVVTWKESHLWILTRPMRTNETAEIYQFKESSSFGILNGTVNIIEQK